METSCNWLITFCSSWMTIDYVFLLWFYLLISAGNQSVYLCAETDTVYPMSVDALWVKSKNTGHLRFSNFINISVSFCSLQINSQVIHPFNPSILIAFCRVCLMGGTISHCHWKHTTLQYVTSGNKMSLQNVSRISSQGRQLQWQCLKGKGVNAMTELHHKDRSIWC